MRALRLSWVCYAIAAMTLGCGSTPPETSGDDPGPVAPDSDLEEIAGTGSDVVDGCESSTDCAHLTPDGPCEEATCDLATGECALTPVEDGATCDDGNECTVEDACVDGECVAAKSLECDDTSACLSATCDPAVGCVTAPVDDGEPCTLGCFGAASCEAGTCKADPSTAVECGAPTPNMKCVKELVCDPSTGECTKAIYELDGTDCDTDDNLCTLEACDGAGECVGSGEVETCASDIAINPCWSYQCIPKDGLCIKQLFLEGKSCNDNDSCTSNDVCQEEFGAKFCLGAVVAIDDDNPCTNDFCDKGTVYHEPLNGVPCNKGGPCALTSLCEAGTCQVGAVKSCNDGNPCTKDSCDVAVGCQNVYEDGPCNDGDPCTSGDQCSSGQCTGTPCQCKSDQECEGAEVGQTACERVACVAFACVAVPDEALSGKACSDDDGCTSGETCSDGVCGGGQPVVCDNADTTGCTTQVCSENTCGPVFATAATACDDGDPCTVGGACDDSGTCVSSAKDCSGFEDQCNDAACVLGACIVVPKTDAACDDGQICTPETTCDGAGSCVGPWDPTIGECGCQADTDCDDGLACTINECSNDKECVATVKSGSCAIGGACYAGQAINPGNQCQRCAPTVSKTTWQAVVCDDAKACTDDSCDPASGCVATADDSNVCNDSDPCTADDHCAGGECTGTCECEQDADCEGTAPACQRWACQAYSCVPVADAAQNAASCGDDLFCTVDDACQDGVCAGKPRDCGAAAQSACSVGTCNEATDQCVPTLVDDGLVCNDDNPCTFDDACAAGTCKGEPLDCSSQADQCHTAACVDGGCEKTATVGSACTDGVACTLEDKCTAAGSCAGTWDEDNCGCDDDAFCKAEFSDACNEGKCNLDTHQCFAAPVDGACDDQDPCTIADSCSSGTCQGAQAPCDDGKSCTTDICDGVGGCTFEVKPGRCLIGDACYLDKQTEPGNPCHICSGGTAWSNADGVACSDDDPCTSGDTCAGGTCAATPYDCPALACQTAACTGDGDCQVTTSAGHCAIAGVCYPSGTPNPNNPCASCQPGKTQSDWSPNNAPCDDGDPCTKSDICGGGTCAGTTYSCSDGKNCTTDTCDGAGGCAYPVKDGSCLLDLTCYGSGATKPSNPCLACNPESPDVWTPKSDVTSCNDGLACTDGDHCDGAGACVGSLAACATLECEDPVCNESGGCDVSIKASRCRIDGVCHNDSDSNPANPCQRCDPAQNQTGWTDSSGGQCDDADACTHSDSCQAGACVGAVYACSDNLACTADTCDGLGGCSYPVDAQACLIGGTCYAANVADPTNECQACTPAAAKTAWSARSGDCADDGKSCTTDVCQGGVCTHGYDSGGGACLIGGTCYADGTKNPATGCQQCDAPATGWTDLGSGCGPDCVICTGGQQCVNDVCACVDQVAVTCDGGDVWWQDSCGALTALKQDCTYGCGDGLCDPPPFPEGFPTVTANYSATSGVAADVLDGDLGTSFISSYDNWQNVVIDFGVPVSVLAFRRYMTKDGSNSSGARYGQGEAFGWYNDATGAWVNVEQDNTCGWEAPIWTSYVNYSGGDAWHSVQYGWTAWLTLNDTVDDSSCSGDGITAQKVRFLWDGNLDAVNELEMKLTEPQ